MFKTLQEPTKFNFVTTSSYKKQEFEIAYIDGLCFVKSDDHYYELSELAALTPDAVDWEDFGECLGKVAMLIWRGYHTCTKL